MYKQIYICIYIYIYIYCNHALFSEAGNFQWALAQVWNNSWLQLQWLQSAGPMSTNLWQSALIISTHKISHRGSQILEPLLVFAPSCPSKAQNLPGSWAYFSRFNFRNKTLVVFTCLENHRMRNLWVTEDYRFLKTKHLSSSHISRRFWDSNKTKRKRLGSFHAVRKLQEAKSRLGSFLENLVPSLLSCSYMFIYECVCFCICLGSCFLPLRLKGLAASATLISIYA